MRADTHCRGRPLFNLQTPVSHQSKGTTDMPQATLFPLDDHIDKPLPTLPHNRSSTSRLAAQSMRSCAGQSMRSCAGAQQQRVLECLQQAGHAGLTDEQIQCALDLSGNSERPRRSKLVELGLVRNTGVIRLTNSGHAAVVWAVVPSDECLPVASKANWPTDGKTNPNQVNNDTLKNSGRNSR